MVTTTDQPFWVIWCPTHGGPSVRHHSKEEAHKEAKRLAHLHADQQFIVLSAEAAYTVRDPVQCIEFNEPPF